MDILSQIQAHKIIAVLRGVKEENMPDVATALQNGGITTLEVTLDSPGALNSISKLSGSGNSLLVGAGTVLNAAGARSAIAAGAKFIISPLLDREVIRISKDAGVISIPGAFTPTEIYQAHNFGADIIKVFPAISPEYISNILGPLSGFRLIPTGGVSVNNIGNFLRAGSFAVGVGSSLVNSKNIVNEASLRELTARAKQFCEAVSAS